MFQLSNLVRILCATVSAAAIFMAGCGSQTSSSNGSGTVVNINPAQLLAGISNSIQQPVTRALGGWEWGGFINSFGSLLTGVSYTLDMQKVTYQSTGADGKAHTMTGLLILPRAIIGAKPSVPILMLQHGT